MLKIIFVWQKRQEEKSFYSIYYVHIKLLKTLGKLIAREL